jgi:hypothetical protein
LGTDMFSGVDDSKTVTVKAPVGADYGDVPSNATENSWGNGFRGGGWAGGAMIYDTWVNGNITLRFETY